MKITIPASIEEATTALSGIDQLLTAKGWERAAIVYAFTHNDGKGRPPANEQKDSFSVSAFAAFGISGLSTRRSVSRYRDAWEENAADLDIKPGDEVTIPAGDFPAHPYPGDEYGHKTPDGMDKTIDRLIDEHGAKKIAERVAEKGGREAVAGTGSALNKGNQRLRKEIEAEWLEDEPDHPRFSDEPQPMGMGTATTFAGHFATIDQSFAKISESLDWLSENYNTVTHDRDMEAAMKEWIPKIRLKLDTLELVSTEDIIGSL